jgi:hypothetical protein
MGLSFNRDASCAVRRGAAFSRIARRPAPILARARCRQSCGICFACAALPWRTLSTPPSARAFDGILPMDVTRRSSSPQSAGCKADIRWLFGLGPRHNTGLARVIRRLVLAGFSVLSVVGVNPPHHGCQRPRLRMSVTQLRSKRAHCNCPVAGPRRLIDRIRPAPRPWAGPGSA